MSEKEQSTGRKKLKFKPKIQPRRPPATATTATPKAEPSGGGDGEFEAEQARRLLSRFNENLRRKVPRVDKKAPVQVAFGPGATSPSTSIRSYGVAKEKMDIDSLSDIEEDGTLDSFSVAIDTKPVKTKDYVEPWDYHHSYYPTTLPLRRPYSGNPELLNKAEFREVGTNMECDETTTSPASDLGLLEESNKEKMILFQFPSKLPLMKQSASAKGKEKVDGSTMSSGKIGSRNVGSLKDLTEGYMGKMLVYKSGAVKLKLGDTIYDVTPGSDCVFYQDVMAINVAGKKCCVLGDIQKRAVVSPDIDLLLNSVINLD